MELVNIVIIGFITIFSLGLLSISAFSYRKYRNIKLLFVTLVFLVFVVKGVVLSLSLFSEQIAMHLSSIHFNLFDLIVLILLFIATLKR